MTLPVITIPWKFLALSNHRLMPVVRWIDRAPKAVLITAPDYRQAKESAEYHIKSQWRGMDKLTGPLQLVALCYFPDRRKRDSVNISKMVCDAMSGLVMEDDSQIEDERWIKAGYDKAEPRVEITLTQLVAPPEKPKRLPKKLGPEIVPVRELLYSAGKNLKRKLHEKP